MRRTTIQLEDQALLTMESEPLFPDFDPLNKDDIEMDKEVNDAFPSQSNESEPSIGGAHVLAIVGHKWIEGRLRLKVDWSTKQSS